MVDKIGRDLMGWCDKKIAASGVFAKTLIMDDRALSELIRDNHPVDFPSNFTDMTPNNCKGNGVCVWV